MDDVIYWISYNSAVIMKIINRGINTLSGQGLIQC